MKKIYILVCFMLFNAALWAQVNVTYQVDVTLYMDTVAIDPAGIRIGGNFTTNGGTNASVPVPDWTPSDPAAAMNANGNVWSITINYPASSIGLTQQFKFVNGDWGKNEGTGPTSMIAVDGCGTDDGAGNINRTIVIPGSDVVYQWCWDMCTKCDGSSPVISGINNVNGNGISLDIFPNPTIGATKIMYGITGNDNVNISLRSFTGQVIKTLVDEIQIPGTHSLDLNTENLPDGVYFVQINVNGVSYNKRLSVTH